MVKMYCGTCMAVRPCVRKEVYDKRGIMVRMDWECRVCGNTDSGSGLLETENEDAEWREDYLKDMGTTNI